MDQQVSMKQEISREIAGNRKQSEGSQYLGLIRGQLDIREQRVIREQEVRRTKQDVNRESAPPPLFTLFGVKPLKRALPVLKPWLSSPHLRERKEGREREEGRE